MLKFRKMCREKSPVEIVDWLAENTDLSKVKLKKGISLGGLWISQGKKKKRVKKIKTQIKSGDFIEFYFNPDLDVDQSVPPTHVFSGKGFGIWFKPASQPVSETPFSDKGCTSYFLKQKFSKVYIINRLDFEVSGLVLVAYNKEMAKILSKAQNDKKIQKYYLAEVKGITPNEGEIDYELEGKKCLTKFQKLSEYEGNSRLEVEIVTGRFHQIRRHFNMFNHPIIGDPKYGSNNKSDIGLQLQAYKLSLPDSLGGSCSLADELLIF
ncbi:MAG: hypothetical protein CME65_13360 [Halobacteriovoraceae bacterium]|nr:hypothetical protein [Halobacteriovoraceae bacterium]|tara:strand:+ start:22581 stop:23378 length:798 start_codon:yes stop_codon:yes gene_type:complete